MDRPVFVFLLPDEAVFLLSLLGAMVTTLCPLVSSPLLLVDHFKMMLTETNILEWGGGRREGREGGGGEEGRRREEERKGGGGRNGGREKQNSGTDLAERL